MLSKPKMGLAKDINQALQIVAEKRTVKQDTKNVTDSGHRLCRLERGRIVGQAACRSRKRLCAWLYKPRLEKAVE